ncbi:FosX/FosE/FosI family fosfomycin resistance hydrolase [Eubacteriales bacterium OttesenSCG-928-M02]|nr:FosX/FosE/FosI family fosfomycin resistance hydrolase [Eubacteriales bacterium OttesenSCG-928-M02]
MIQGISHITLLVTDVKKTAAMLQQVLDAQMVYDSERKAFSLSREIFLTIGGVWIAIMEGEGPERKSYHHLAFSVAEQDFPMYAARIAEAGLEIRPGRPRVDGEGESLYFYDYDNHLLELHTGTLEDRLSAYQKVPSRG